VSEFNFPAFHRAANHYRSMGWTVFSPAENDIEKNGYDPSVLQPDGDGAALTNTAGFDRRAALADDLNWIALNADAIHMLPGWEKSGGAFAEWALAKTLELKFYYGEI